MRLFISGERIVLRPLALEDLEGAYPSWFDDEVVCEYNSHHVYPYSKDYLANYIENATDNKYQLVFAIIERSSKKHIGNIALQQIDYVVRQADLSFILGDHASWGKGYGYEAGSLVINHAFNALNLNRIYLGTTDHNHGMLKLAEKLGFTVEGRRRAAAYKQGVYRDIIEFGLLKKEWCNHVGNHTSSGRL